MRDGPGPTRAPARTRRLRRRLGLRRRRAVPARGRAGARGRPRLGVGPRARPADVAPARGVGGRSTSRATTSPSCSRSSAGRGDPAARRCRSSSASAGSAFEVVLERTGDVLGGRYVVPRVPRGRYPFEVLDRRARRPVRARALGGSARRRRRARRLPAPRRARRALQRGGRARPGRPAPAAAARRRASTSTACASTSRASRSAACTGGRPRSAGS